MTKVIISIITIFSLLFIVVNADHQSQEPRWPFENQCRGEENVAKLHFFAHYITSGQANNVTTYEVARASITSNSSSGFGLMQVLDVLLTAGPDIDSEEVGQVQGLLTSADMKEVAAAMNINFVFTTGEYNGSTISVLGRNPLYSETREFPVVGGTGIFRMARGYGITNNYSYDPVANNGIFEFTLYVNYICQLNENYAN